MTALAAGALAAACGVVALLLLPIGEPAITARLRHPEAAALEDAGWPHGPLAWEAMRGCCVLAAAMAAGAWGLPLLIAAAAAAAIPSLWLRARAASAREGHRRARTRSVVALEAALRSGASLPDALRRAIDSVDDPRASRPLADALSSFGLGASLDQALRDTAAGVEERRVRIALETLAIGVAERLPRERLADLVGSLADRLTFEDRLDDEVRARAGGARMQVHLLAALVPALALYLSATMPGLAAILDGPLGRTVLVPAAIALEVAGVVLSRRIVRVVGR